MSRKNISKSVECSILLKSRRRCCVCFWFEGDDDIVDGQIAHLDKDNTNPKEQNLVYLCLKHHNMYDSKTSVSKGLTKGEITKCRDELHKEMEYRFRTIQTKALTMLFDETLHCYENKNKQKMYRIAVRNTGTTTVKNVSAKITDITSVRPEQNDELRKFVGLKMCCSVNPFGSYSHPDNPPESSVILHPGEEATFDFVQLCFLPGNFSIHHAQFFLNPQSSRLEQRPQGVISPGRYTITISAQGDDLDPQVRRFEISSSDTSVTFSPK